MPSKGVGVRGASFGRVVVGVKSWAGVGVPCCMVAGVGGGMLGALGFVGVEGVTEVDVACGVVPGVPDIRRVMSEASNSAARRTLT